MILSTLLASSLFPRSALHEIVEGIRPGFAIGREKPKPSTELVVPELVNTVIPDGTFAVGLHTGQIAVYLVEIHRSTQSKAVTEQLNRYFEVIQSDTIARKYATRSTR